MIDPIGQVWTPFANVRGDVYSYADARDPDDAGTVADDTVLRGVAAAGVLYSYPFVAHTASASHVIAPTAQIIARPNKRRPAQPAGRGRQEPHLRRHAAVRHRQVLGLRPLRDRHARQRRRAVHVAGQQRRLCALRVRPELPPRRRQRRDRSTPASTRPASSTSRRSAASDRPLRLRGRPLSVARSPAQPRCPGPLRREGLVAAAAGHGAAGLLRPAPGQVGLHLHALRSRAPACIDKQQEIMATLGLRLTDRWSVVGSDALRHR